jgi:hypothetical protein
MNFAGTTVIRISLSFRSALSLAPQGEPPAFPGRALPEWGAATTGFLNYLAGLSSVLT